MPRHQYTLRSILLVATVLPPLVGGFCGALGPYVQLWLVLAFGIPALALALLGLTFAVGYLLFVLPVVVVAEAAQRVWDEVGGEQIQPSNPKPTHNSPLAQS